MRARGGHQLILIDGDRKRELSFIRNIDRDAERNWRYKTQNTTDVVDMEHRGIFVRSLKRGKSFQNHIDGIRLIFSQYIELGTDSNNNNKKKNIDHG